MSEKAKMTETGIENAENALMEMSQKGQYVSLTRGVSMNPMLRHHRDMIIVCPVTKPLKKYDIPLYMRENSDDLVLHRILKVRENDYIIRGDNTYSLEYVPKDYVIGVLKEFYRDGKYINCETNLKYRIYSVLVVFFHPLIKLWKFKIRPFLSKIKQKLKRILNK